MPEADPFIKQYLVTAGPTPLPPQVAQAMNVPLGYHRHPDFVDLLRRVASGLKYVHGTGSEVLVFAASGTGAMESAVVNLVRAGEKVLVASSGKFGERWAEICAGHGVSAEHLAFEWGEKVDPERVGDALDRAGGEMKVLFTTHSETSTGVVNDVAELALVAHDRGAMICVDAISSVGAVDLRMDEWGIDVVVSGSQKALMSPPGLAFAAVGERALAHARDRTDGHYYFSWGRTHAAQRKADPSSPFTPAISLMLGLDAALGLIRDEGRERIFARTALLARATRAAFDGIGLERFGAPDEGANVVSVARIPDGVDGERVSKLMREKRGVTPAGGQGPLKGRIVRIGHCGHYGAFDVIVAVAALEQALDEAGFQFQLGSGLAAAQRVFCDAGDGVER